MAALPSNPRGTSRPSHTLRKIKPSSRFVVAIRRLKTSVSCDRITDIVRGVRSWRRSRTSQPELEDSRGRSFLQITTHVMDVAFSIAETIPVLGTPLKGAIEAVCKVLRLLEQQLSNADDLAEIVDRLESLMDILQKITVPNFLIERLIRRLLATERKLNSLLSKDWVWDSGVSQALANCTSCIDSCLIEFSALTLATIGIAQSERLALECVTVLDPFGAPQKIPRDSMLSTEIVGLIIVEIYSFNKHMKRALDQVIRGRMYELNMDNGEDITTVTDSLISSVGQQGSKVVMSVIILVDVDELELVSCPVCGGTFPISQNERTLCATCNRGVSAVKVEMGGPGATKQDSDGSENPFSTASGVDASALFQHVTINHVLTRTEPLSEEEKHSDVSDGVQLGHWREIDASEAAYYQSNDWKWEDQMTGVDHSWVIFNQ